MGRWSWDLEVEDQSISVVAHWELGMEKQSWVSGTSETCGEETEYHRMGDLELYVA